MTYQDIQNQETKMMQLRDIFASVEEDRKSGRAGCTVKDLDALLAREIEHTLGESA